MLRGEAQGEVLSEDDPVIEHELRPCVFLGRELLLSVYTLLDERRRRVRLGVDLTPPRITASALPGCRGGTSTTESR